MVNKNFLSYKKRFAKAIEFYTETLKKLRIYTIKTCQPCGQFVKQPPKSKWRLLPILSGNRYDYNLPT